MKFYPVVLPLVLLATSSCSVKQHLDEMHDATVAMNGKTDKLLNASCTMYLSLRQGNAKVSRDQDFQDIQNAKDLSGKLAEAAQYMQGFEYQVWAPACIDEIHVTRDQALEQAARELLTNSIDFIQDRSKVGATKTSEEYQNLYALAATLHYANVLQGDFLLGTSEKVYRPFDVLVKGLELDQKRNRGEMSEADFPSFAEVVGKYRTDALYLLRLRQNFLLVYAWALADGDKNGNQPGILKKLQLLGFLPSKWKPRLDIRSSTEIRERIVASLNYAIETHEALKNLGVDPMLNPDLITVWNLADFSKIDLDGMEKSTSKETRGKAKSIRELIQARDQIVELSGLAK